MKNIKTIYCDFDGTITKKDMVNTFFEQFADEKWVESEKLWIDGKISSRENAIIQVGMLQEMDEKTLNDFINTFEIDESFADFVNFAQSKGIKVVILSDGFDLFIKKILERLNLKNVDFYANHLIFKNNKFNIEFPYFNENCKKQAGMCKCSKIKEKEFCYVGDGTSDLCVAQKAKFLFATKSLMKYCKEKSIDFVQFNSFSDIVECMKLSL